MTGGYEFCWVTHSAESREVYPARRSHRDPTADAAIGNVLREERRKKKQGKFQKHRIGVWRAPEKGESYAGK